MTRAPYGGHKKFLDEVACSDTDECVLWPYAIDQDGYGLCKRNRRTNRVHRVVCEIVHGEPPSSEHQAAHSCGTRACANPKHIRWATPKENTHDKFGHGSMRRGEQISQSKLSDIDVSTIKRRLARQSGSSLAKEFGVSEPTISMIKHGLRWGHVE